MSEKYKLVFKDSDKKIKDHYGDGDLQKERDGEQDDFYVILESSRDGYGIDQVEDNTMTVGELINYLSQFPEDAKIVIGNDSRGGYYYTYGRITDNSIATMEITESEEEEDYEDVR